MNRIFFFIMSIISATRSSISK